MIRTHDAAGRDLSALVEDFFRTTFATDNPLITEAVRRMLAAGGKRLRPRLALLAAEAGGGDPRAHLALAAYMELIHVGTLIHDDVVDGAQMRRGVNATAVDYGNRVSVLAGDYLFAWIFKNVTADYPAPIPHILSATLADITDGEVLQLRARGNLRLTVDGYVEIVDKKTAALFAASAECGAITVGAPALVCAALREYGKNLGIAFQMLDDVLDLTADEGALGKPVGNDLRERKVTIPLILALASGGTELRHEAERFFSSDATSADLAAAARLARAIVAAGGASKTHDAIEGYVERAKAALPALGNVPARAELGTLADGLARDSSRRTR
jgi:octaprenyl-diphosphate synthase